MQKQYAYFSAAIRAGARLRPQGFGHFHYQGKTCAYGAALEVIRHMQDRPERLFPYLVSVAKCPAKCETEVAMGGLVVHLNDVHRWTREAIADWLYAEEEKLGFITITIIFIICMRATPLGEWE